MRPQMSEPLHSFMGPWDAIFILSPAIKLTSLSTNAHKCAGIVYKVYAMDPLWLNILNIIVFFGPNKNASCSVLFSQTWIIRILIHLRFSNWQLSLVSNTRLDQLGRNGASVLQLKLLPVYVPERSSYIEQSGTLWDKRLPASLAMNKFR